MAGRSGTRRATAGSDVAPMRKATPSTSRARGRPVRSAGPVRAAPPGPAAPGRSRPDRPLADRWVVRESRSVRSVWVWRGFLMMALLAVGVAIVLAANGHTGLAAAWGVIAAGWLGISLWLWRQHHLLSRDA